MNVVFDEKRIYRQDAKSAKKSKASNRTENWFMTTISDKPIGRRVHVIEKILLGALGVLAVNSG